MARIQWGERDRRYEAGLDRGVVYLPTVALPWNGLISLDEEVVGPGEFAGTLSAFSYPPEILTTPAPGVPGPSRTFGMSYRTEKDGVDLIHILYYARVRPLGGSWETISDSPTPTVRQWAIFADSIDLPGAQPSAHLIMEIRQDADPYIIQFLEDAIYGSDGSDPHLPTPDEIVTLFEESTKLRITVHSDGTYTAEGPADVLEIHEDGSFTLNSPGVLKITESIFVAESH